MRCRPMLFPGSAGGSGALLTTPVCAMKLEPDQLVVFMSLKNVFSRNEGSLARGGRVGCDDAFAFAADGALLVAAPDCLSPVMMLNSRTAARGATCDRCLSINFGSRTPTFGEASTAAMVLSSH